MNLVARIEVLSEKTQSDLGHGYSVCRIDTHMRCHRCVRGSTMKVKVALRDGECGELVALSGCRVNHHCQICAIESASLKHQNLSPTLFFGGSSEYSNREPQIIRHVLECQTSPDSGGRDDVVTAGVTNVWQCIKFGADGDS